MRCYDCNKEADVLFPVMQVCGRIPITVYVCKTCLKAKGDSE